MFRFLLRRLLLTIPVLFGVATLVFALIHLVPGDPAQAMLGEGASAQDLVELRERLGLNRPLFVQYTSFLSGLIRGDLGVSLSRNQPVTTLILERIPATAELAFAAMAVAIALAIPLLPRGRVGHLLEQTPVHKTTTGARCRRGARVSSTCGASKESAMPSRCARSSS